jgi:hypothetical protein
MPFSTIIIGTGQIRKSRLDMPQFHGINNYKEVCNLSIISIEDFADCLFQGREIEFHVGNMNCFASLYVGDRVGKEVCIHNCTTDYYQYFLIPQSLVEMATIERRLLKDCWSEVVIDDMA